MRGYTIRITVLTAGVRKSSKNIRELGGAGTTAAKGLNVAKGAAAALGAVLTSQLLGSIARSGMEMESLKARVNDTAAFKKLSEFAKENGLQIEGVADSYTKLRNLGIEPTMARMEAFGNVAAAQGKGLQQFSEAVADAATNEFERLKEFGIKASQQGEQVTFTFQGLTQTVGKNSQEIVRYLEDIGKTKFAGEMSRQAQTTRGILNTLNLEVKELASAIWDGGMKDATQFFIKALREITSVVRSFHDHTGGLRGTFEGMKSLLAEGGAALFDVLGDEEVARNLRKTANEAANAFYEIKEGLVGAGDAADDAGPKMDKLKRKVEELGESGTGGVSELEKAMNRLIDSAKTEAERAEEDFQEAGRIMQEALADGLTDEAAVKKVMDFYSLRLGEVKPPDVTVYGDDPGSDLGDHEDAVGRIRTDYEGIANSIAGFIGELTDGTADWLDMLNAAVNLWEDIANAAGRSQGGATATNADGSTSASGGSSGRDLAQYASYANAAIAVYTAVFDYADALVERHKSKRYSLPVTTGAFGTNAYGGQAIGNNIIDTTEVAHLQEGFANALEGFLTVIGGFVTDLDEFGVEIQQSGDLFKAVAGDTVIGVFSTMQEAFEQAAKFALKRADFEGIGDNMAIALKNSTAVTMERFLKDLNLARFVDDLGASDLELQIRDMSRTFLRAAEDARRLGLDVGAISAGFLGEMESIRNRILGIHKSEYEQRLDDADAYNRAIRERIEQLKRYMQSLATIVDVSGSGGVGGPGAGAHGINPQGGGGHGGLQRFDYDPAGLFSGGDVEDYYKSLFGQTADIAEAMGNIEGAAFPAIHALNALGDAATGLAEDAVDPAVQAILDEIDELEKSLIDPADIKKKTGGGGGGRRDAIARLNDEIERLGRVSGGPVSDALTAANDNFDRLEKEARRLRQPLEELIRLREEERAAIVGTARGDFLDDWHRWTNDFGPLQELFANTGAEANAFAERIRDLGEAGALSADEVTHLLAQLGPQGWRNAHAAVLAFKDDLLLTLYGYLGDTEASAELQWRLSMAELEAKRAELAIAVEHGHITQEAFNHISGLVDQVIAAGRPEGPPPPITGGSSGPTWQDIVRDFRRELERAADANFGSLEEIRERFQDLYDTRPIGVALSEWQESLEEAVEAFRERMLEPIRDLRDEILGDTSGGISGRERFEQLQAQYLEVAGRIRSGDASALEDLPGIISNFRSVAQDYLGNASLGALEQQFLALLGLAENLEIDAGVSGGQVFVEGQAPTGPGPLSASAYGHGIGVLQSTYQRIGAEASVERVAIRNELSSLRTLMGDFLANQELGRPA